MLKSLIHVEILQNLFKRWFWGLRRKLSSYTHCFSRGSRFDSQPPNGISHNIFRGCSALSHLPTAPMCITTRIHIFKEKNKIFFLNCALNNTIVSFIPDWHPSKSKGFLFCFLITFQLLWCQDNMYQVRHQKFRSVAKHCPMAQAFSWIAPQNY